MCTAATYQTECFYMGRTLDYEFSYGEEITITPREFPLNSGMEERSPITTRSSEWLTLRAATRSTTTP